MPKFIQTINAYNAVQTRGFLPADQTELKTLQRKGKHGPITFTLVGHKKEHSKLQALCSLARYVFFKLRDKLCYCCLKSKNASYYKERWNEWKTAEKVTAIYLRTDLVPRSPVNNLQEESVEIEQPREEEKNNTTIQQSTTENSTEGDTVDDTKSSTLVTKKSETEAEKRARILALVKKDGLKLAKFPEYQNDWEIVEAAIDQNWEAIDYAADELFPQDSEEDAPIDSATSLINLKPELKETQDTPENSNDTHDSKEFTQKPESDSKPNYTTLEKMEIMECWKEVNQRELEIADILEDGLNLEKYPQFQKDYAIARAAVEQNPDAIKFVSPDCRMYKKIFLLAYCLSNKVLAMVPKENYKKFLGEIEQIRKDKEAIIENGLLLEDHPKLKNSPSLVIKAIMTHWRTLEYVGNELRNNKETVKSAIEGDGRAILCASEELQQDPELLELAVKKNNKAFEENPKLFFNCRKALLTVVRRDERAFFHLSDELKNDYEIALKAVRKGRKAMDGVSNDLKKNREFMLAVIHRYGVCVKYAAKELWQEDQFISDAIDANELTLVYLSTVKWYTKHLNKKADAKNIAAQVYEHTSFFVSHYNRLKPESQKLVLDWLGKKPDNKFLYESVIKRIEENLSE